MHDLTEKEFEAFSSRLRFQSKTVEDVEQIRLEAWEKYWTCAGLPAVDGGPVNELQRLAQVDKLTYFGQLANLIKTYTEIRAGRHQPGVYLLYQGDVY